MLTKTNPLTMVIATDACCCEMVKNDTVHDPSEVALITLTQAIPNRPIPMIAPGEIMRVRTKRMDVNKI
jgi:hypothetical protein